MRATLLTLSIILTLIPSRSIAQENFTCFDTPNGEHRCACIGVAGAVLSHLESVLRGG